MAIIELGMDSNAVRAFQERACHFRRDLEIYVYDTEWSDLDVEQLSAPWPRWPKYSSAADLMPRSPQAITDDKKDAMPIWESMVIDSDEEEAPLDKNGRPHFSMYARNSTNFDAM
ncbi:hypothetical protein BGW42_007327, partial [Actinomortierella wolfii]